MNGDVPFRSLWSFTPKLLVKPGYGQGPDPCRSQALWTQGSVGNLCYSPVRVSYSPSPSSHILDSVFLTHSLFAVCFIILWSFTTTGLWVELQVPGSLAHSSSHTPSIVHISGLTWTSVEKTPLWAGPGRLLIGALKVSCTCEQNLRMAGWFRELKARCPFWWRWIKVMIVCRDKKVRARWWDHTE